MEGNLSEFSRNLGRCSDFFVTFYWKSAAIGVHLYVGVVTIFINVLLSLCGTFTNVLIIVVYGTTRRLRTLSNMLLVTLAASDLLVTAVVQPLCAVRMLKEVFGTHDCFLWTWVRLASYFSCGVSLLTVGIITVERFITLAYPYHHRTILTPTRLKITISSTWFASLAVVVSHLGLIPYNILVLVGAGLVLFTISTIVAIWLWILRLLRRHRARIKTTQTPSSMDNKSLNCKQVFRTTKTSYLIVAALLFCYFPTLVMLAYFSTEPNDFVAIFLVTPLAETLMFANSALNPLLLFWRKSDFRNTARELLVKLRYYIKKGQGS